MLTLQYPTVTSIKSTIEEIQQDINNGFDVNGFHILSWCANQQNQAEILTKLGVSDVDELENELLKGILSIKKPA